MKIAVIIVNYKNYTDTSETIDWLLKAKVPEQFEIDIVLVDNESEDEKINEIRKKYPKIHMLINRENLGFAEGNNIGIRFALKREAHYVLLLNSDTRVDKEIFEKLIPFAFAHKSGGLFSPKIYFENNFETHKERYLPKEIGKVIWYAGGIVDWKNMFASHRGVDEVDSGQYRESGKTIYGTGCALLVKKEVFEKVGLLDSKLFLYYEDFDLSMRAKRKGFDTYYVADAVVWHKNANSQGGTGSSIQTYYITRNRLLIGMRYAPWRTKLALFREATNLLMRGTTLQRHAVGDFLRKKFGKKQDISRLALRLPSVNLWKIIGRTKKEK